MDLNKKRVLIFIDWFVPGFKAGGPIQSCRNLAENISSGMDVYIFTSDRDLNDHSSYESVQFDQWVSYKPGVFVFYASPKNQKVNFLKKIIKEVNPSAIYLNSMFSVKFTLFPLFLLLTGNIKTKVIVAPRGMLQAGALQFKSFKKKLFLSLFKISGLHSKIQFHATVDKEVAEIQSAFGGNCSVTMIPNLSLAKETAGSQAYKTPGTVRLIMVGRISPIKNIAYLLEILLYNKFIGNIQLTIVGKEEDAAYWSYCQNLIAKLPPNMSVKAVGALSHDLAMAEMQKADFFVSPTLGENFGHSILEAIQFGKPVIISDQTPWRRLREKGVGWDIPLENKLLFVHAINSALAMDQLEYDQMSDACIKFAAEASDNMINNKKYIELFS